MREKQRYYGKIFVIFLFITGLFILSIKPITQDISAISPASQLTLQGQLPIEDTEEIQNEEQEQEQEERTEPTAKVEQQKQTQLETVEPITTPPVAIRTDLPTLPTDNSPTVMENEHHIEITDTVEDGQAYFTTNLHNGMTVTTPSYYVTITQLDDTLIVKDQQIELNHKLLDPFTGELTFKEGENQVSITIFYEDLDGQAHSAKQSYMLILNTKDIVIQTTATNEEVTEAAFRFTASASLAGTDLPLEILLNDKMISPQAGHAYAVTLQPGENTLTLTASAGMKQQQVRYFIHYKEQQAQLVFDTDLFNQKVAQSQFNFTASAFYGAQTIDFTASLNGEALQASTTFSVQLANGLNTIQLHTIHEDEQLTKQFKVLYSDPNVAVTEPTNELAPTIKTDLVAGTHVKGLIKTINVWPTTAEGVRIRGKNVAVTVNGVGTPFVWDDAEKTSYKLSLQNGENLVEIRTWDDEGRVAKETFKLTAEDMDNGVIGQVTLSVEASVLGIPYLIPPTKMDIHQAEKGSFIIDQLLRQYGFSYNHTGTLASNFYLSALKKSNMLANLSIPDDLWLLVEESSTRAIRDDFDRHSLGEFDFANGSGWMFSVNGDYPNYGFSDAYFLDGDVVRIRFTLHYGKDIRGFSGMGGGSDSNWDKEW